MLPAQGPHVARHAASLRIPPNLSLSDDHSEAIVVGSGLGGAVAACRLEERGWSYYLLGDLT
jgi:hypothetical protein